MRTGGSSSHRSSCPSRWPTLGCKSCAPETNEEALRLASGRNLARLLSLTGRAKGIPSPEEAQAYAYQPNEWEYIQKYASLCLDGDPQQVKEKMLALAEAYQTPDLSVVTICYGFKERVRSYQLVAEACGINDRE